MACLFDSSVYGCVVVLKECITDVKVRLHCHSPLSEEPILLEAEVSQVRQSMSCAELRVHGYSHIQCF